MQISRDRQLAINMELEETMERNRLCLSELVNNHTKELGRLVGHRGNIIPNSNQNALLVALLNDCSQSAFAYWYWKRNTDKAIWQTSLLVDSVKIAKNQLCGKGIDYWEAEARSMGFSQKLQLWYKHIEYLPPKSLYAIGGDGNEYPHPSELLMIIDVVLEALMDYAFEKTYLFSEDSEEGEILKDIHASAQTVRKQLLDTHRLIARS